MRVLTFAFLALASVWCGAQPIQPTVSIRTFGKASPQVTVQPNGDFFVHGFFDYINGKSVGRLAKLSSLGQPIETFAHVAVNDVISQVQMLPSHKLLVAGYFDNLNGTPVKSLIRLNEDGSYDNSFVSAVDNIYSFAVQSNNEIVVKKGDNYVVKLNADGSINNSFTTFYATEKLKVDAQDRIYALAGTGIVRRQPDGSEDPSFTQNTSPGTVYDYDLSPSGDIFVGGTFTAYNNTPVYNLALLDQNGNLKSSFNAPSSTMSNIYAVLALASGKFLIGGLDYSIFQIEADGSISGSFATSNYNVIRSLDETPDHKVIVGGEFTLMNGRPRTFMALINADRSVNGDFKPIVTSAAQFQSFAVNGNRSILIINEELGNNVIPGFPAMTKYNGFGKPDEPFNWNVPLYPWIRSILFQESGKFLLAGSWVTAENQAVARFNSDGSPDKSFPLIQTAKDNQSDGPILKAIEYKGILYACGQFTSVNTVPSRGFIALSKDGEFEKTFKSIPENIGISDFAFQSDGKIIVCIAFDTNPGYANIIRINSDGTVDDTFPTYTLPNGGNIAVDASDRIYIYGGFWKANDVPVNRLMRLSSNGSIDHSFNIGTGPNNDVWCLEVLPDNNIAFGGYFSKYNNAEANGFVIVDPNGSEVANPVISFAKDSWVFSMAQKNKSLYVSGRLFPTSANEIFTLMQFPLAPEQMPSAPKNLTVKMAGKDSLSISWTDTSDEEIAFILERSMTNGDHFVAYDTLSGVSALDTHVSVETEYFYRLKAVNHTYSSPYSEVVSFIPTEPITGVAEQPNVATSIYPNPSQHTITLSCPEMPVGGSWVLTNSMGVKQVVQPNKIDNGYTLDISTFSAGWYHLAYISPNGVTFSAKWIRN